MEFIILIIVLSIAIFIPSLLIWGIGNLIFKLFNMHRHLTFWQSVLIYLMLFMLKSFVTKAEHQQVKK